MKMNLVDRLAKAISSELRKRTFVPENPNAAHSFDSLCEDHIILSEQTSHDIAASVIASIGESESDQDAFAFSHADKGMTRFPPNVEQIVVERDPLKKWLVVRRNNIKLRFPLSEADCRHLAALLTNAN
jgi:hypothetical protein